MTEPSFDSLLNVISGIKEDLGSVKTSVEYIKYNIADVTDTVRDLNVYKIQTEALVKERTREVNKMMGKWGVAASIVATLISGFSTYIVNHFSGASGLPIDTGTQVMYNQKPIQNPPHPR